MCLFIDLFVFCFNHCRTPTGSFPENFLEIKIDLAEILRIRKLDWHDGGGEEKGREGKESYFVMVYYQYDNLMIIYRFCNVHI